MFQKDVEGAWAKDAMELVLLTEYFDALQVIGAQEKNSTVFIPYSPAGIANIVGHLRNSILEVEAAKKV